MQRQCFLLAGVAAWIALMAGPSRPMANAQYSRKSPIVEAVRKTRAGIVTIKVSRADAEDSREIVGTGVVVDERGYVVTNHHVIAPAGGIRVILCDATPLPARVVAVDKDFDLAILRVHAGRALQPLSLGPASDLMVGETIIAVGHPFGYTNTVSTGIVSAVGREITMPSGAVLTDLIQINASINPGNSGGPLLNINGELIGINVALREGAQGIAFAINSDQVKDMLSRSLSLPRMAGLRHGLACSEKVRPEGPSRQRVVVNGVDPRAPAARAGIRPGDEIIQVAGHPVGNRFDVERTLWGHHAGERIPLRIVRDGREITLAITLAPTADQGAVTTIHYEPASAGEEDRGR